ncbi:uncharacterized protein LOC106052707 isoform X4 [Biomphalaria glabrata]|uniref:Uncharacterized protein LOC106052707 isoform X2 n=1 Tax=Biomphalaria glabrata TaxID=6526 RepID=A0A9W2Z7R4_BIOGL|nr:uncharacterized protein LOC106052707 isoform X2 [Biomphalaria glabrata]XP_055871065.1 uncharacterized protein LOC106052707 isoform X3 [Biomphalaria glabrata]XP_055871066.1 uncharacterized protein LOC106052707 isoform X4 [Biomphalaria glabrata]
MKALPKERMKEKKTRNRMKEKKTRNRMKKKKTRNRETKEAQGDLEDLLIRIQTQTTRRETVTRLLKKLKTTLTTMLTIKAPLRTPRHKVIVK